MLLFLKGHFTGCSKLEEQKLATKRTADAMGSFVTRPAKVQHLIPNHPPADSDSDVANVSDDEPAQDSDEEK